MQLGPLSVLLKQSSDAARTTPLVCAALATPRHRTAVLFASSIRASQRPLAVSASAPKGIETTGMAEFRDVAPHVLNTVQLSVQYGGKAVTDGQHLGKAQAAHAPTVEYAAAPGKHYTLIMVDPDAPSPDNPVMKEWLHWIVTNIPGSDVAKGFTVTEYAGPTPPRGTHRYIFLLYEQPDGVLLPAKHQEQRAKFHADAWAKAHQLGDPVAARYFMTAAGE